MKKFLCCALALVMCLGAMSAPAMAASVGEELTFVAGSEGGTQIGSSNTDTRTESQREADTVNSRNHKRITEKSRDIIEQMKEHKIPVYAKAEDTITLVWKDRVPKEELVWIGQEGSDYAPGTNHHTGRWDWEELYGDATDSQLDTLRFEVIPGQQGITPSIKTSWFDWITLEPGDNPSDIGDFVSKFEDQGGYYITNRIPGATYIVDFDTFMTRYDVLREYLNTFASYSDTVDVNYIVQYSLRSSAQNELRTSIPQCWPGTQMTHFWEIECVGAPDDGYTRAPFSTFANEELRQTFYYAGDYRVTATQLLKNSYSDAFTWNVCEYLVIEETGQVIWKNEVAGARIDTSRNAKPMSEQRLWHVTYTNMNPNSEFVYVTKYDKLWTITNNVLVGGQLPSSAWGDEYTTVRIE